MSYTLVSRAARPDDSTNAYEGHQRRLIIHTNTKIVLQTAKMVEASASNNARHTKQLQEAA